MLQTRSGKGPQWLGSSCLVEEGLITKQEALLLVDPRQLDTLLHPTFEPNALKAATPIGSPASPGAATGHIYFTAEGCGRSS